MTTEVRYYNQWSRYKKRPLKAWTEDQACHAHQQRTLYTVVIGTTEAPQCFIEVHLGNQFIGVFFLDEHQRNHRSYLFKVQDEKLFLHEYLERSFDSSSDTVTGATRYFYELDGSVIKQLADVQTGITTQQEIGKNIDITQNWEPIPDFGHYDGIIRQGRALFTG